MSKLQFDNLLFLDIETVPQVYFFDDLSPESRDLFSSKNRSRINEDKTAAEVYKELGGIQS